MEYGEILNCTADSCPGKIDLIKIFLNNGNFHDNCVTNWSILAAGNWSAWKNITACTKTCGNGTWTIQRLCDDPMPGPNGKQCIMENGTYGLTETKYGADCNMFPCPSK